MRDVVIIDAVRSPFGKVNGSLADVHPVDLLADTIKGLVERTGIEPGMVNDVIGGCVHQHAQQGLNVTRNAWLAAGYPETVPAVTIDRQCGSSLQAVQFAAHGVMAGAYDIVIACGVDSKSRVVSDGRSRENSPWVQRLEERIQIEDPWFIPIKNAELIANKWDLTRDVLDEYGYRSQSLASKAEKNGVLAKQIIPIKKNNGEVVSYDQGIRHDSKLEKIKTLNTIFDLKKMTAANSSQVTDGASAVLMMSVEKAKELGLKPRARFVEFSVVGSNLTELLTGPIPATQEVLRKSGLSLEEIGAFEVNEAFASVVLAWAKELGAPLEKTNIHGGAIALGHPAGATGGRLIGAILSALEERNERYGLIAICEGGGMANAAIIERL